MAIQIFCSACLPICNTIVLMKDEVYVCVRMCASECVIVLFVLLLCSFFELKPLRSQNQCLTLRGNIAEFCKIFCKSQTKLPL